MIRTVLLLLAAGVPLALTPPAGQQLLWQTHGAGDQIYVCKATGSATGTWALKAPDARLLGQDGKEEGRHFAGPTWEAHDGSRVQAKSVATVDSPDAGAVPWLLLKATTREGHGLLSGVLSIQRLNTIGGKAPQGGCDAARTRTELRVPYQADYLFYGNRQ